MRIHTSGRISDLDFVAARNTCILHVVPTSKYALTHGLWNEATTQLYSSGRTHQLFHTFSRAMATCVSSATGGAS